MAVTWKIFLIFAVLTVHIAAQQQSKYGNSNSENDKLENSKSKATRGIGISAWGLVFLIVVVILLGAAAYYVVIFYPFLCKEERRYDRIELATI